MIPLDDRGLLLGDGVFETILAKDGVLDAWTAHLARMRAGCETLGLPEPDAAEALGLCRDALATSGLTQGRAAVRLTLTAGSGGRGLDRPAAPTIRLFATAAPSPAPTGPARLHTATTRRNAASPASNLKTLSYLDNVLARREALAAGRDEAAMLDGSGRVSCAGAANIFWMQDGRLFTPAPRCGVLPGIMRARILAAAERAGAAATEVEAGIEEAKAADAVFLTNSLIGLRSVASWDEAAYGAFAIPDWLGAVLP